MAKYIDAYKLEKDLPQSVPKHNVIINGNEYPVFLVDHILHKIRNYPTADVVEVKYGEWILNTDDFTPKMRCSVCGYNKPLVAGENIVQEPNYFCNNCGAKMRGDT